MNLAIQVKRQVLARISTIKRCVDVNAKQSAPNYKKGKFYIITLFYDETGKHRKSGHLPA